jgi:asparagine synthase (glutamine-hydrolysing)
LLSYLELKFYLQNQLLKDTDFMSMFHSVEVRVPFLDHPLVEYLSSLPPEVKLGASDVLMTCDVPNIDRLISGHRKSKNLADFSKLNKPLLVAAVYDMLPSGVLSRSKMGFTFPFQRWFKELNLQTYQLKNLKTGTHWSRAWAKEVLEKYF